MPGRLQINFEFSSTEDRLMLRVSDKGTDKCVEYRLWLTRRFVNIFLRAIEKLLEDDLSEMERLGFAASLSEKSVRKQFDIKLTDKDEEEIERAKVDLNLLLTEYGSLANLRLLITGKKVEIDNMSSARFRSQPSQGFFDDQLDAIFNFDEEEEL